MPSPHESGFRRKNNGLTERSLHALSSRVRFQKEEQWSDREVPACPLLTFPNAVAPLANRYTLRGMPDNTR